MGWKYNVAGCSVATAIAVVFNYYAFGNMIFGGTTPRTCTPEWREATRKRYNAWPRHYGSPVVLNPIINQNFRVKKMPHEKKLKEEKMKKLAA